MSVLLAKILIRSLRRRAFRTNRKITSLSVRKFPIAKKISRSSAMCAPFGPSSRTYDRIGTVSEVHPPTRHGLPLPELLGIQTSCPVRNHSPWIDWHVLLVRSEPPFNVYSAACALAFMLENVSSLNKFGFSLGKWHLLAPFHEQASSPSQSDYFYLKRPQRETRFCR